MVFLAGDDVRTKAEIRFSLYSSFTSTFLSRQDGLLAHCHDTILDFVILARGMTLWPCRASGPCLWNVGLGIPRYIGL